MLLLFVVFQRVVLLLVAVARCGAAGDINNLLIDGMAHFVVVVSVERRLLLFVVLLCDVLLVVVVVRSGAAGDMKNLLIDGMARFIVEVGKN